MGRDRQGDDGRRDRYGRPVPERRDSERGTPAGANRVGPGVPDRVSGRLGVDPASPRDRPVPRTSDSRREVRGEAARAGRPGLLPGKVFVAVISAVVLVGTGYYSSRLNDFTEGLTTADVIDAPPVEKPADGAIDILMVGLDSRNDNQGNPMSKEQLAMLSAGVADGELNTDTLIMVRIPNDGGPVVGVSFPRDSYVDIANGYGQHKINSAYARAKNDAMGKLRGEGVSDQAELQVRSNKEGAKNVIATIQDLTGVTIEHYAQINLLGFYDITNAIGGIDVCLNAPVKDRYSGANFPAGPQTLAGKQALAFVRQRHGLPNGDLDRIVRQQVFMSGMARKVLSGDMLAPGSDALDQLQSAIQKSVVLDKDWNVLQFAQQMMGITGGKVGFQTIPHGTIDLRTRGDGSAIEIDPGQVRDFVQGLIGPKDHKSGTSASEPPDNAAAKNESITVNVRNASGRRGLAGDVAEELAAKGFAKGDVGNANPRQDTVVRHATGEQDSGNRVATALGGNPRVEEDSNLPAGSVTVLLGADYGGPGSSGSGNAESGGDGLAHEPLLGLSGSHPVQAQQPNPPQKGCVN